MRSFSRVVSIASAWIVILAAPVAAQVNLVGFQQFDWRNYNSAVNQNNSLWGSVRYTYPASGATSYLNLTLTQSSGGPTIGNWAIQNLPLFAVDNGDFSLRDEIVNLNLAPLIGSAGIDWSSTFFRWEVTPVPLNASTLLPAIHAPATVSDFLQSPTDSPDEPPDQGVLNDPGFPLPVGIVGPAFKFIPKRDVRRVKEDLNHCAAGSMARSIDWLNREHNLGMNKTAQQIYADLVAAGVSQPRADRQPARTGWVSAKNTYARAQTGNQIVTKVWDRGNEIGAIPGVTETTGGDFITWLKGEIASGEDVELAYFFTGGAHIVTIVDAYTEDNKLYVDYRDDEDQRGPVNSTGDTAVKRGKQIYLTTPDGAYHFGADKNTIYFAVSESFVPEPSAMIVVAGAAVAVFRRRGRCA